MKRILCLLMTFVMLLGSFTVLTSCGKPKDDGAEINIYLGAQVFDFDPSDYYVSSNAERLLGLLYEPLFTLKKNGKIKCAAADGYDVDKKEHKIIIDIRESYWSDGIQLKAADFVYAWCERIINSVNPNPAAALFLDIEGVREAMNGEGSISDVGIKATEMDQITITYREGADYKRILRNLASVATAPVRQDIVEESPTTWSKSTVVTNGPFKVKSYKDDGTFELTRNLGYHQEPTVKDYDNKVRPGLLYGECTFDGSDFSVSYQDIENNVTFIMADASLTDRKEYKKKAKVADDTSTYTYVFNTSHPLFSDINARKALSAVIDREAIIDAITFGKPADGFIPDVSGGARKDIISTESNLDQAKRYLALVDKTVLAENRTFTLAIDSDEQSIAIAEIVAAAWKELGFDVKITPLAVKKTELSDGSEVTDSGVQYLVKSVAMGTATFDVIGLDWQTYSIDPLAGLASLTSILNGMGRQPISGVPSDGGTPDSSVIRSNIAGWSSAKYDRLVLEASACANKKDRKKLLIEAEKCLIEEMPVCPLVFNQSFVFTHSKISKVKFDGLGNMSLTNVKLAGYRKYFRPKEEE